MSSPKPETFRRTASYLAIICIGYAVDLACYITLTVLGLHPYVAYFIAFFAGATCNVALLRRYFSAGRHLFAKDLALTLGSNGAVILLAFGAYALLMTVLGVQHLVSKIISNTLSALINYYTRRAYF